MNWTEKTWIVATCGRGCVGALQGELRALGYDPQEVSPTSVGIEGDLRDAMRLNLWLRTPTACCSRWPASNRLARRTACRRARPAVGGMAASRHPLPRPRRRPPSLHHRFPLCGAPLQGCHRRPLCGRHRRAPRLHVHPRRRRLHRPVLERPDRADLPRYQRGAALAPRLPLAILDRAPARNAGRRHSAGTGLAEGSRRGLHRPHVRQRHPGHRGRLDRPAPRPRPRARGLRLPASERRGRRPVDGAQGRGARALVAAPRTWIAASDVAPPAIACARENAGPRGRGQPDPLPYLRFPRHPAAQAPRAGADEPRIWRTARGGRPPGAAVRIHRRLLQGHLPGHARGGVHRQPAARPQDRPAPRPPHPDVERRHRMPPARVRHLRGHPRPPPDPQAFRPAAPQ
jgi:hypothetical protein